MGLGISLPGFIAQLVSFGILLFLLIFFGYKPIRNMLDQRANKVREGLEQAEAAKQEYEHAQVEAQKQIEEARKQGEALVAQARQIGDRLKEEAKVEARKEAQAIVDRTRVELDRERDKIIDDLRREFVETAILAAERVIKETLDREKHRRLIEEALEESAVLRRN